MKSVTKNNMLKYIEMKKQYMKNKDAKLLEEINKFTNEVINKDKHYFKKLKSYNFSTEDLSYCMEFGGSKEFLIVDDRVPKESRDKDLYYYELREYDNGEGYTIEKKVIVNFAGTLISRVELLHNKEYIDYNDFLKKMNITLLKTQK